MHSYINTGLNTNIWWSFFSEFNIICKSLKTFNNYKFKSLNADKFVRVIHWFQPRQHKKCTTANYFQTKIVSPKFHQRDSWALIPYNGKQANFLQRDEFKSLAGVWFPSTSPAVGGGRLAGPGGDGAGFLPWYLKKYLDSSIKAAKYQNVRIFLIFFIFFMVQAVAVSCSWQNTSVVDLIESKVSRKLACSKASAQFQNLFGSNLMKKLQHIDPSGQNVPWHDHVANRTCLPAVPDTVLTLRDRKRPNGQKGDAIKVL